MDYAKFSDQELIHAYVSGKESCINEIIQRHQARVFGYILMTVKDKEIAEDIFQDTFIKVINKLKSDSYVEEGKFIQWVMRIAHNLVIDHFRRTNRFRMVRSNDEYDVFNTIEVYDKNAEDEIIEKQTHDKVRQLVEMLPESQREVLKMRHYSEMSFKDIAETTGVSINTALGRMRYALINLRKLIEEHNIVLSK
jgi:RNA polymerase sigma-70 factor (ECF subfamily)